jgi:hypothetical protein
MQGFLPQHGLSAERQILVGRQASAPALSELVTVLADGSAAGPASSVDVLRRLPPQAGMEVLTALRGGSTQPSPWAAAGRAAWAPGRVS